jgi:uncharacterized repeat protein (TIGR02543 family)
MKLLDGVRRGGKRKGDIVKYVGKMLRRVLSVSLAGILAFSLSAAPTAFGGEATEIAAQSPSLTPLSETTGVCGSNLTWTLDTATGVFTISGSGLMYEYDYLPEIPWDSVKRSIRSVVISDGITSISRHAFQNCYFLKNVSIPSSVTSISSDAFAYCGALVSITIPSSVTSIGERAFLSCSSLVSFTIPSSITTIREKTFDYCISLVSITIPSSVTSIGESVFFRCFSLASVVLPSSLTSIGQSAFRECTSLTSITLPPSLTSLASFSFQDCTSLVSVSIPSSVTSIEDNTFRNCSSLVSITIPSSVTSIGYSAFRDCSSIKSVTIPSSVVTISDLAFAYCSSLKSAIIPASVTTVDYGAFLGCPGLSIRCYEGSAAHAYALEEKIAFSLMGQLTLKLRAGGGKLSVTGVKRSYGASVGRLPSPTRAGYSFLGWFTTPSGGAKVTANTKVSKSVTYYAHWRAKGLIIVFDANGGRLSNRAEVAHTVRSKAAAMGRLPVPTRAGYAFKGWYTGKVKGTRVGATTRVTKGLTFYAHWERVSCRISFAANGGKVAGKKVASVKRAYKGQIGKLPTPKRVGYSFQGWYTGKVKGTKVSAKTKVSRDVTLYARWKRRA